MKTIRELFSPDRPIDRRIEKVIDYYAADEDRLAAEIEEYEATENVEACFRKFLEVYQAGVQGGQVAEIGIWVAGFYGSGKSSFTKYLGFALDTSRHVHGRLFLDLLSDRLHSADVRASLRTIAKQMPTAVVMLDLGAEQLAESATISVTNVLYWKVLQLAGYSKEKKLAQLEFTLDQKALYDGFRAAYLEQYSTPWEEIHNDPLLGVARASRLLPRFLPNEFPDQDSFSKLSFELAEDVRDLARRMIELVRRHTKRNNIIFLIDETGQYVAPRGELILNLDGLARNFKELGQGKVWIMATGQQTLAEIVERAAYNTTELNKLRDRFPISIELDARDIRKITYLRLLTKEEEGAKRLRQLFEMNGQSMIAHTRLSGTPLYKDDPSTEEFVRLYPFLPQHFEVLMLLIRRLARGGGVGLRSVIRVIQDVLVDTSRILPPDTPKLADRAIGTLATVDGFYKTLRGDINKHLPHVVEAVDTVERMFPDRPFHHRVAQAVAALQQLEDFPRTAENIAALLYPALGSESLLEDVRRVLEDLVSAKEVGLIEDPQSGGYLFLSASVGPLQRKRTEYAPTSGELARARNQVLRSLLEPQPAVRLENTKDVPAAVRAGRTWLIGEREDIVFQLEMVSGDQWDSRRQQLIQETAQQTEYQNVVIWLFRQDDVAEDILQEIRKSEKIVGDIDERTADKDVAQYRRAEDKLAERNRERVALKLGESLLAGTFVFRGQPTPARQVAETLQAATQAMLGEVAGKVFHQYQLVKLRAGTDLAAKFLEVDRLDRMPRDRDPLGLVVRQAGVPRVNTNHPALAETLREFKTMVEQSGGGRLTGSAIQDHFAAPPYGWLKDAVRYLFAALLVGGEVEFHSGGEVLKTAGPAAAEAAKSTLAFNRVGVGLRGTKVSLEVQDQAARRLEILFGGAVLPLEDDISKAARKHLPAVHLITLSLPDRLRLLGLPGEERARDLRAQIEEVLKGDAAEAASRLGVQQSRLPDDIRWAQDVHHALDNEGETKIRQASRLIADLSDLDSLFPGQRETLGLAEDGERLRSILDSERFYEQLPDLRGIMRRVRQRIEASYVDGWTSYAIALEQAQDALESHADWLRLASEDQAELAGRLSPRLPETPGASTLLGDYKTLVAQTRGIPALLGDLQREVERRRPVIETPAPKTTPLQHEAAMRLDEREAELAEARKLEYLGIMASAMAHGLNQPIGIIRLVSSAALSDLEGHLLPPEEVPQRFKKIMTQTDRLAIIVENMRAFARGDSRPREAVDLSQIVAQMCDMFADQFRGRHIRLEWAAESCQPPLIVRANPVQLQEVMINLLSNARDAVEGRPDAWVGATCFLGEVDRCGFRVEDNGPGLSHEYRERLFIPFVTTKPSEKGTGLGLFTSRRVIADLGGELRYEDRSDGGACFIVELPLQHES